MFCMAFTCKYDVIIIFLILTSHRAGYLLLLIYSAANLCDRSWGTREQSSGEDEGLWGWRVYFIHAWRKLTSLWCCVKCCWGGERGGREAPPPPAPERLEVVLSEEQEGRQGGGEEGDSSGTVDATEGEETYTESRELPNVMCNSSRVLHYMDTSFA